MSTAAKSAGTRNKEGIQKWTLAMAKFQFFCGGLAPLDSWYAPCAPSTFERTHRTDGSEDGRKNWHYRFANSSLSLTKGFRLSHGPVHKDMSQPYRTGSRVAARKLGPLHGATTGGTNRKLSDPVERQGRLGAKCLDGNSLSKEPNTR